MIETKKLETNHLITEIENNPNLMPPDVFTETLYNDLKTTQSAYNASATTLLERKHIVIRKPLDVTRLSL